MATVDRQTLDLARIYVRTLTGRSCIDDVVLTRHDIDLRRDAPGREYQIKIESLTDQQIDIGFGSCFKIVCRRLNGIFRSPQCQNAECAIVFGRDRTGFARLLIGNCHACTGNDGAVRVRHGTRNAPLIGLCRYVNYKSKYEYKYRCECLYECVRFHHHSFEKLLFIRISGGL